MKRILIPMLIFALLVLSGCDAAVGNAAVVPTAEATTPATATSVTSTAEAQTPSPVPSATVPAFTATSATATIRLISVEDAGEPGKALLKWEAEGSFPSGFKIVWSGSNDSPTFPEDNWSYVSDGAARQAVIQADAGLGYFFRVCRYVNGVCDSYSNTIQFWLAQTAKPTATRVSGATTPQSYGIRIIDVDDTTSGNALITWEAWGSFPNGFKVVWSNSTQTPKYPDNEWLYASDPNSRTAGVYGTPGATYWFRVCRYNGSGCDFYSAAREFTFTTEGSTPPTASSDSITITSISDTSSGNATINWSASGSFPNGFKVAWSATNPNPTYPADTWAYISDGGARSANVTGTPGTTYYFRVCKYTGGACGIYSPTYTFAFAGTPPVPTVDTSSITITGISAIDATSANVTWSASGSFPNGFKIVWSTTSTTPVYPGDSYTYMSDPASTYGPMTGLTSGTTYHVRVCRYTGGGCDVYSGTLDYVAP